MPHFSWFFLIPGVQDGSAFPFLAEGTRGEAYAIPTAWLVCVFIVILAVAARMGLERAKKAGLAGLVPDSGFSTRNLMEIYTSSIFGLATNVLGPKDARTFFPLLGGLFIYILVSNFLGLIPGFLPPTAVVLNNAALAVVVFLVFNLAGLKRNGLHYIKHLGGPILVLSPFLFIIETLGLFVRPVSLTLRLAGNMFGDHMVFGIMSNLVPILLPVPFIGLGMFVSFIQALVFTLLSTVYIALSVADMREHH